MSIASSANQLHRIFMTRTRRSVLAPPPKEKREVRRGSPAISVAIRDPLVSFLVEHICDTVREHAIGGSENVERFAEQNNLAVGDDAVPEESLVNVFPG